MVITFDMSTGEVEYEDGLTAGTRQAPRPEVECPARDEFDGRHLELRLLTIDEAVAIERRRR